MCSDGEGDCKVAKEGDATKVHIPQKNPERINDVYIGELFVGNPP